MVANPQGSRIRSTFAMSNAIVRAVAATWLEELGCLADRRPGTARDQDFLVLAVDHDAELADEVRHIVVLVDPRAYCVD